MFRGVNLEEAIFIECNFEDVNFSRSSLAHSYFENCTFKNCFLYSTNLACIEFKNSFIQNCDFENSYLKLTRLKCVDFKDVDGSNTDITGAYFNCCNFENINIRYANLTRTKFLECKSNNIKYNTSTSFYNLAYPSKGSYIGFKSASNYNNDKVIVELLITEDSLRSSATTRKCRASKAKVLSITSIDGTINYDKAISKHDNSFVYKVGEIVEVEDFNKDRWVECTSGIHHFITREEAVNY